MTFNMAGKQDSPAIVDTKVNEIDDNSGNAALTQLAVDGGKDAEHNVTEQEITINNNKTKDEVDVPGLPHEGCETLNQEEGQRSSVGDSQHTENTSESLNAELTTDAEKGVKTDSSDLMHDSQNAGVTSITETNTGLIETDSANDIVLESSKDVVTKDSKAGASDVLQSVYFLKQFKWGGEQIQIVTQNENGPCPLLAIANVLVLSKRIMLPPMQECITASQLMEYIGDYTLSAGPKNVDEAMLLNYQQNMHDAISIMYKLQTGIDVNVKFTGPRDFEFTSECLVFDLLNIGLYHGWLVDPQDLNTVTAVGPLSYNQLVEKVIKSKESDAEENAISEGLLAEAFLDSAASQLTYHGLCELNNAIRDEEICVFFRNNHFSTLYKHQGELFLLVTDQGYLNQSRIIWETLANVDGAGQFVDGTFHTVGPLSYQAPRAEPKPPVIPGDQLSQEDKDYLIALSLQEEARPSSQDVPAFQARQHSERNETVEFSPAQQEANDLALAQRLQDEERQHARQQQPQRNTQGPQHVRQPQSPNLQQSPAEVARSPPVDPKNQGHCTIL